MGHHWPFIGGQNPHSPQDPGTIIETGRTIFAAAEEKEIKAPGVTSGGIILVSSEGGESSTAFIISRTASKGFKVKTGAATTVNWVVFA